VRQIIRDEGIDHNYRRENQCKPKLGEYEVTLESWLIADSKLRRKERRKATKYFAELQSLGYAGAYDSVQRYVKAWRRQYAQPNGAYVPLSFDQGDAYQFDWSEEWIEIGGQRRKIKLAHFRLCHSRAFFVIAYWRETQEMLFDAHNQAFPFFGGLPNRGIYDNMKTAVSQIVIGKERQFTSGFQSLMDHYRIEPVACNPGAGWEKEQVDKIRDWLFKPCPKVSDLDELNAFLHRRCEELMQKHAHPVYRDRMIAQVLADERSHLRDLNTLYDGHLEKDVRVNSMCLVRFDRNAYSVESSYANALVTLRIYSTCIEVYADGKLIGHHRRQFGREHVSFDPLHYLPC
jgi:transposase